MVFDFAAECGVRFSLSYSTGLRCRCQVPCGDDMGHGQLGRGLLLVAVGQLRQTGCAKGEMFLTTLLNASSK